MSSKTVSAFFLYICIRFVGFFVNVLPFALALYLSRPVGALLFIVLKKRRASAIENLRQAYGKEKSEKEIRDIARGSFIYLAEFGVEWLRMPDFVYHPERYLAVRHAERLQEALKAGNGAMIVAAHHGNQEIMALIAAHLIAKPVQASIYVVARPLKNSFLYTYATRLRGLTGMQSINKYGGVRATFDLLKQNHIVCIAADQRVREGSVEAKFFGRTALTTSLPAIAALRYHVPVFHVYLERTPDLRYIMSVEGPIPVVRTGKISQDMLNYMQAYNDRTEAAIRQNPSHWLWMHNRWRLY